MHGMEVLLFFDNSHGSSLFRRLDILTSQLVNSNY